MLSKSCNSRHLFFLLPFLLLLIHTHAQDKKRGYLEIHGVAEFYNMEPFAGVDVKLYINDKVVDQKKSGGNGEFTLKLDLDQVYTVELSEKGYISKKIKFDTKMPAEEGGAWFTDFAMSMLEVCDNLTENVFEEPLARVYFNGKKREFQNDDDYDKKVGRKIQNLTWDWEDCREKKYFDALDGGDKLYQQKKYVEAKEKFLTAHDLRPDEKYPVKMIAELDELIKEASANKKIYEDAIEKADEEFNNKSYVAALASYKKASLYDPAAHYPKDKISEIQGILSSKEQARQEKQLVQSNYETMVEKGDMALNGNNFMEAKNFYQQALDIKPGEMYPREKINELQQLIAREEQENRLAGEKEMAYNQKMEEANKLEESGQLEEALLAYREAINMKPEASMPKQKITTINQKIESQKEALALKKESEKEQMFNSNLDKADEYLDNDNPGLALTYYKKALELKPDDTYTRSRISRAEKLVGDKLEEERLQQAEKQAQEDKYNQLLAKAESLYQLEEYKEALNTYNYALEIKPNGSKANERIEEINRVFAQEEKEAAAAKQQDIQRKQEKENEFNRLISLADQSYNNEQLEEAISYYNKALELKPNDSYSTSRVKVAREKKQQKQENERRAMALKQAKENEYDQAIAKAESLYKLNEYSQALELYQMALEIKPGELLPANRMGEIKNLLAARDKEEAGKKLREQRFGNYVREGNLAFSAGNYKEAMEKYKLANSIIPGKTEVTSKISEIESIQANQQRELAEQKQHERKYSDLIARADNALSMDNLSQAKVLYNQARQMKPSDNYTREKLLAIDQKMLEQSRDEDYRKLIASADGLYKMKEYDAAKKIYQDALNLKPGDSYVQTKIEQIRNDVNEIAAREASERANDELYQAHVNKGNQFFSRGEYKLAREEYARAKSVKPEETFPGRKVAEIDKLIQDQQLQEQYNNKIGEADRVLASGDLSRAREIYYQALEIKPGDGYARGKIGTIDEQVADRERQQQQEAEKENRYNQSIQLADNYFNKAEYDAAENEYRKALDYKPGSAYPKQKLARIKEINKLLASSGSGSSGGTKTPPPSKPEASTSKVVIKELKFNNQAELDKYLKMLKNSYPEGVTLEVYREEYKTTRRFIVIRDDDVSEYREVKHSWGGVDYYKNDKPITSGYFSQQTRKREGEFYKEFQK